MSNIPTSNEVTHAVDSLMGTTSTAPNSVVGDFRRLLAVAIVLPAVIVIVDQWLIATRPSNPGIALALPLVFVVQVGILGMCTGRFVENAFLRCVVFTW